MRIAGALTASMARRGVAARRCLRALRRCLCLRRLDRGEQWAVKRHMVRSEQVRAEVIERVAHELALVSKLSHPHLLRYYGVEARCAGSSALR